MAARHALKKTFHAVSRLLGNTLYHQKWVAYFGCVIAKRGKIFFGPPPPSLSNDPAVRNELKEQWLLDDRQKSRGADPSNLSEKAYHIEKVFELSNFCLVCNGDIWHFHGPQCPCNGTEEDFKQKLAYHMIMLFERGCPQFLYSRFTKIFTAPSYIAPALVVNAIGTQAFQLAFSKDVDTAVKEIRSAHNADLAAGQASGAFLDGDRNMKIENSQRLVTTSASLSQELFRLETTLFLGYGRRVLPLMWTIFKGDDAGGCVGAKATSTTYRDIVYKTREVQRSVRDCLKEDNPLLKTVLAIKPTAMTNDEAFQILRASSFCISSDILYKFDRRRVQICKMQQNKLKLVKT